MMAIFNRQHKGLQWLYGRLYNVRKRFLTDISLVVSMFTVWIYPNTITPSKNEHFYSVLDVVNL
jgi:hypothetical protein